MKKILSLIIIGVFLLTVCGCSSDNNTLQETTVAETTAIATTIEPTTEEPTTAVPTTIQPTTEEPTKSFLELKNEYINRCEEYDYDEILFAPDRYRSNYAKFEGKVKAICDDDGKWFVLQTYDGDIVDVKGPAEYYQLDNEVVVYGKLADVITPYYFDKNVVQIKAKYVEFK